MNLKKKFFAFKIIENEMIIIGQYLIQTLLTEQGNWCKYTLSFYSRKALKMREKDIVSGQELRQMLLT